MSRTASRPAAATARRRRRANASQGPRSRSARSTSTRSTARQLVTQLINKVLPDGKKQVAERIVYTALEGCREKTGTDPVVTLKRALDNVKPTLEVKSAASVARPTRCRSRSRPAARTTLALRWLVGYAADRREKTMSERLMNEILDASNGLGAAVKKREDTHKMAESNKAFAHYRW